MADYIYQHNMTYIRPGKIVTCFTCYYSTETTNCQIIPPTMYEAPKTCDGKIWLYLAPKLPSPIYDDWEQQDPFNILKEFINFCSGYSCVSFTVGQNVVFVWKAPSSVADIKGRLDWGEIFGNRMREAWCCPSPHAQCPWSSYPHPPFYSCQLVCLDGTNTLGQPSYF